MSIQAVPCEPIFWLPPEVILHNVLPYLNIHELATVQKTCRYFCEAVKEYVTHILVTPHALGIVAKYGFEPLSDPRNKIIIQKAFEACYFEEEDNITPETLAEKFKMVEDRNLVKIYYHFKYGQVIGTVSDLVNQLWVASKTDIAATAATIRECCKQEKHLSSRYRQNLDHLLYLHILPLGFSEELPLSFRYISVIPPEIQYFGTCGIHAPQNRIMLISKQIHKALRETFGGSAKCNKVIGDLDISNNQLGTLPKEARKLWGLRQDGSKRPVLWQQQNDENPEVLISFV